MSNSNLKLTFKKSDSTFGSDDEVDIQFSPSSVNDSSLRTKQQGIKTRHYVPVGYNQTYCIIKRGKI